MILWSLYILLILTASEHVMCTFFSTTFVIDDTAPKDGNQPPKLPPDGADEASVPSSTFLTSETHQTQNLAT